MRDSSHSQRVAVLSHVLPPSSSGQAVVLYRLLRDWDPTTYCLISTKDYSVHDSSPTETVTARLAGDYHHLPAELQFRLLESPIVKAARHLVGGAKNMRGLFRKPSAPTASAVAPVVANLVAAPPSASVLGRVKARFRTMIQNWDNRVNPRFQVKQRACAIEAILRKEKCTALVACSGDLLDPPAGFLAAQRAGVPYYSYMFDDYERQWIVPSMRAFGLSVCPQVIRQAAGVIVPNEFLADVYRQRHGIDSIIVRNPVDAVQVFSPRTIVNRPFRIVFTGTIYEAHFDAFVRMMQALARLPANDVEFHVYTSSAPSFLAHYGIGPPAILHPSVSNAESLHIQRSADALFLPLAFSSPFPDIINTSAPGKMGEYLASSRPVLVHSPAESFLSWYCRRHECAIVVDVADVNALHQAILDLMDTPALRQRVALNAWRRAVADFHLPAVSTCFAKVFEWNAAQATRLGA
jgi:glycosyltransferase involved in cell wall biosynthesis